MYPETFINAISRIILGNITMELTLMQWVYGTVQFAVVILSVIAGLIAISMYKLTRGKAELKPWNSMIIVLVLFAVVEVLGGLATFGVYRTPHLTHVTASLLLVFFIQALLRKISITKGWIDE